MPKSESDNSSEDELNEESLSVDSYIIEDIDDICIDDITNPDMANTISNQIKKENRIFTNRLSKYEYTKIVSFRAEQIRRNQSKIFYKGEEKNPYKIAIIETMQKLIPILIRRNYPGSKKYELWDLKEMTIPRFVI